MSRVYKMRCAFCQRSDETDKTGTLSCKEKVAAHQNCLLYASGIYCENTPEFDDLFGFSVKEVMKEIKRGSRLLCNKCKKKGATAGCEVGRCKRSYHYPCALEAGAKTFESKERFGLFCPSHCLLSVGNSASSSPSSQTSTTSCQAGPSKKQWNYSPIQSEPAAERKFKKIRRATLEYSSDSGEDEEMEANLAMFAPLEYDIEEESQEPETRKAGEGLTSPTDAESENASFLPAAAAAGAREAQPDSPSLLPAAVADAWTQASQEPIVVKDDDEPTSERSPAHSPGPHTAASPLPDPADAPELRPRPASVSSPAAPEPSIDPASFWRSCNAAGCTKAIFTGFIQEMNDMADRIQSERASPEDYDLALSVMEASGKLANLVNKQNEELERKLKELSQAGASMQKVLSALKR